MGVLQVFPLRTVNSTIQDMGVSQRLTTATDRDYHMQQIGVRKFDHALSRLPFHLYIRAPMDKMHVELLGNVTEHLSKLLWKMFRELGWSEWRRRTRRPARAPTAHRSTRLAPLNAQSLR